MKFIFWGGIILFIGAIGLILFNFDDIKVEQNGIFVKMRIEKLPNSCLGTRVKHFTTLTYEGQRFIKRIGGKFCDDHHIGELIDMKYLEGSSTVLFPDESVVSNLLAFSALGLLGMLMSFSQWRKIKKG